MNKYLIFILSALFLSSCTVYQDIEVKEVRAVRITKFSKDGIEAEIDLKIYNPNNYKVTMVSMDADMYVNGKDMGDANLGNQVTLAKKSNEIHTIKLEGDYTDLGGSLLETIIGALFAKTVNLKIDGTIRGKALMVGKDIYFKVDQDVKLEK